MTKNPLISVIVPCYNYGRFIGETLVSLQEQTYSNWECIVVNDGSTDNSEEVVLAASKKDPRIKYIYQKNKGLPGARNTGIKHAKGEFLQFLDSDDLLQSRKFELQIKAFRENDSLELSYTGLRYFHDGKPDDLIYSSSIFNKPWTLSKSGAGKGLVRYFIISCCIMPPMPLIKKKVLMKKVGKFTIDLKSCEDWEYWFRCAFNNMEFEYLDAPETLSLMRLHPSSMTKNRKVMLNAMIEVRKRIDNKLINQNLKILNQSFLSNDLIEYYVEKQKFEGKISNYLKLLKVGWQRKSSKMLLFANISVLLPYKANLFLLELLRSAGKKIAYRF